MPCTLHFLRRWQPKIPWQSLCNYTVIWLRSVWQTTCQSLKKKNHELEEGSAEVKHRREEAHELTEDLLPPQEPEISWTNGNHFYRQWGCSSKSKNICIYTIVIEHAKWHCFFFTPYPSSFKEVGVWSLEPCASKTVMNVQRSFQSPSRNFIFLKCTKWLPSYDVK